MISSEGKKQSDGQTGLVVKRRLPIGAETQPGDGVHFRVWAPLRKQVEVIIEEGAFNPDHAQCRAVRLEPEPDWIFFRIRRCCVARSSVPLPARRTKRSIPIPHPGSSLWDRTAVPGG